MLQKLHERFSYSYVHVTCKSYSYLHVTFVEYVEGKQLKTPHMKKSRQKLKKTYLHELNKSQTSQGEQKRLLSFPHDQGVQEACGK